MDLRLIERNGQHRATTRASWAMNMMLAPAWFYRALIIILSVWILHSFLHALLAACVTAVASWPLYRRFAACLPSRIGRSATSLIFTCVMAVFVLAPLMFAVGRCSPKLTRCSSTSRPRDQQRNRRSALAGERAAGRTVAGGPLAERARAPGDAPAVGAADRPDCCCWAGRNHWDSSWLAMRSSSHSRSCCCSSCTRKVNRWRRGSGECCASASASGSNGYLDVATRAVRASVNSMLVVGLFDGLATGGRIRDGRRAARRRVGRDHRCARARPVPRLRGRHRTGVAAGDEGRRLAGALLTFGLGCCRSCCAATRSCDPWSRAMASVCPSCGFLWAVWAASRCLDSSGWWSARSCSPSHGNCGSSAFAMWRRPTRPTRVLPAEEPPRDASRAAEADLLSR